MGDFTTMDNTADDLSGTTGTAESGPDNKHEDAPATVSTTVRDPDAGTEQSETDGTTDTPDPVSTGASGPAAANEAEAEDHQADLKTEDGELKGAYKPIDAPDRTEQQATDDDRARGEELAKLKPEDAVEKVREDTGTVSTLTLGAAE